jgi:hypothetical protein
MVYYKKDFETLRFETVNGPRFFALSPASFFSLLRDLASPVVAAARAYSHALAWHEACDAVRAT